MCVKLTFRPIRIASDSYLKPKELTRNSSSYNLYSHHFSWLQIVFMLIFHSTFRCFLLLHCFEDTLCLYFLVYYLTFLTWTSILITFLQSQPTLFCFSSDPQILYRVPMEPQCVEGERSGFPTPRFNWRI